MYQEIDQTHSESWGWGVDNIPRSLDDIAPSDEVWVYAALSNALSTGVYHVFGSYCTVGTRGCIQHTTRYSVVIYCFSHLMNCIRSSFSSILLTAVPQMGGHIAGSPPRLPTTVRVWHFIRRKLQNFFSR